MDFTTTTITAAAAAATVIAVGGGAATIHASIERKSHKIYLNVQHTSEFVS